MLEVETTAYAAGGGFCAGHGMERKADMQAIEIKRDDGMVLRGCRKDPEGTVKAAVCLVHGLGEHGGRYGDVTGHLLREGIAILALDQRGHGLSEGRRGHLAPRAAVIDDVDAMLLKARETWPGVPVWLYGHSLGGNIVLSHRLYGKVKAAGTVATSPWLILASPPSALLVSVMQIGSRLMPAMTIKNGLPVDGLSHDAALNRAYLDDPLVHPFISMLTAKDAMEMANEVISRAAEDFGPLLLMHGGADPICSVEGSRKLAAGAGARCTFHEWPGMRHELHHESIWPELAEEIAMWILQGGQK
mgnify:CR=1 FL=1